MREYKIHESIAFRKTTAPFGGLSNMAGGYSLNIHGILIKSAEHLYQAMRFPYHPHIQAEILAEYSPMTAKMKSKKYKEKYTRQDFEDIKFQIMKWVLEVKLSQNWQTFGKLLLATENKPIVEYTPKDKVWGAILEGDKYIGKNALGRLLMELRENTVKLNYHPRCIAPVKAPDFLLFNHPIGIVCDDSYYYDLEAMQVKGYELA